MVSGHWTFVKPRPSCPHDHAHSPVPNFNPSYLISLSYRQVISTTTSVGERQLVVKRQKLSISTGQCVKRRVLMLQLVIVILRAQHNKTGAAANQSDPSLRISTLFTNMLSIQSDKDQHNYSLIWTDVLLACIACYTRIQLLSHNILLTHFWKEFVSKHWEQTSEAS